MNQKYEGYSYDDKQTEECRKSLEKVAKPVIAYFISSVILAIVFGITNSFVALSGPLFISGLAVFSLWGIPLWKRCKHCNKMMRQDSIREKGGDKIYYVCHHCKTYFYSGVDAE